MKRRIASLLTALCITSTAAAGQIVVITESVLEHQAAPGDKYTGVINLRNVSAEPHDAKIYQTDYLFYSDGRNLFGVPGSAPRSNARWVTFTPDLITVPPGQTVAVQYAVSVPKDGAPLVGTYWSMLMIETITPRSPESLQRPDTAPQMGLKTTMRYGTQIVTDVAGTGRMELAFDKVRAVASHGDVGAVLSLDVTNTGDRGARPRMTLELYDGAGKLVSKVKQQRGLLFPGTSLRQDFQVGALRPGKYKAVVVADAGGDDLFGGQYDVTF